MRKAFASIAEEFVARHLISCGYQIIARNARHIGFELDIVAWRKPDLAIVEVKLRQRKVTALEDWEQLLPRKKRQTLWRGAKWIEREYRSLPVDSMRFDLAIVIWDKNKDVFTLDYREHIDLN